MKNIKLAVTGAAGQIAYSLLPRIASGEMFGQQCEVSLRLLEVAPALSALNGIMMELEDCAFPRLKEVVITDSAERAFEGVNFAILVGAKPRGPGMERADLIRENGPIFVEQGKALSGAAEDVRIVVVGNPCNTNCLIAAANASGLDASCFSAMTMLDQNRAAAMLAEKAGVPVSSMSNVAIWGNHSSTMFADFEHAKINGRAAVEVIGDRAWLEGDFLKAVQERGAEVIKARGHSSALSAANAIVDHVQSLITPTKEGDFFSAAVASDGSYGIPEGLIFSFPVRSDGESLSIVQGLEISEFARGKIDITKAELLVEQNSVKELL